jgi:hypothetical protein
MTSLCLKALCVLGSTAVVSALASSAAAATGGEVESGSKGLVGGVLLGAEAVDLGLALGGVRSSWPYWAFGAVGAAGGGWLGYTVDQSASPTGSMLLLAGGVALVIPTVILSLDATSYHPPESARALPGALVGLQPGALRVGLPMPEVRPLYTAQERATHGLPQRAEVRVPVLSGSF